MRCLLGLLVLASTPGCLSAEFSTIRFDQAPPEAAVARVQEGMSLQECLNLLGAPTAVRRDDEGIRTVMSWEWFEAGGFGVSLSVPLTDNGSASVDYGSDREQVRQVQLFFNSELEVVEISEDRAR